MRIGIGAVFLIAFSIVFSIDLQADYLFYSDGLRVDIGNESPSPSEVSSLAASVKSSCGETSDDICVNWAVHLGSVSQPVELEVALVQALSRWDRGSLNLSVPQQTSDGSIPYLREDGEILTDEFGNSMVEGDFIVSFDPPDEIEFPEGRVVVVKHYLIPNLDSNEAEIAWAGIYINPAFNPYMDCDSNSEVCLDASGYGAFSIFSVLMFGIGKALGLNPSTVPGSVMFPTQDPSDQVNYFHLAPSDEYQLNSRYSGNSPVGEIRGQVINGNDGSPWKGAEILAVPVQRMEDYVEGDLASIVATTLTGKSGRFEFKRLPTGSYFLIAQSIVGDRYQPGLFDEWNQLFAQETSFPRDFYDGKGRESNHEESGVSPQAIFYAASLDVIEGETTKPVEIITDATNPEAEKITAVGSSNESLSDLIFESINTDIRQRPELGTDTNGCQIAAHSQPTEFLGFLVICLLALIQLGRRVKSQTFESP